MKILNALLIAVVFPALVSSQVIIDSITTVDPGDDILQFLDLAPEGVEITSPGENQTWDWTLSEAVEQIAVFDTNDRMDEFPFATIKMTEGAVESYYFISDTTTTWELQGFVAEDPVGLGLNVTSFYTPAFSQEYAPVLYEDSVVQVFAVYTGIPLTVIPDTLLDMLPVRPDSLRLKVSTLVLDDIDAWGNLHIEGTSGEVVQSVDVLRQRRETRIAIAIEAKINIFPWVDVTSLLLDLVDSLPGGIALNDTIVAYRFLAPGYALPIAELTVDNDTVRSVLYQAEIIVALKNVVLEPSDIKIFPNPSSGEINISVSGTDRIVDRVIVHDLTGRLVCALETNGYQELIQIRMNSFPGGMYFLTLIDEEGILIGTGKVCLIDN